MANNPYAPPMTDVADVPQVAHSTPVFYAVSMSKLLVLSGATFGLYTIYWMHRNWQLYRQRTGEPISPFLRSAFAVIFAYQLFKHIDDQAEVWKTRRVAAGPLAIFWVATAFLSRLPEPFMFMALLSILALLPVQRAVNELNAVAAPGHDANTRFRGWNWVAVFLGLPFWALVLIGTLLPEP